MDFQAALGKYTPFIKQNILVVALASAGLILIIYGLISLFTSFHEPEPIVFEASSEQSSPAKKSIVVDVEGAVVKPGVYSLKDDSRVQDALIQAGGLSQEADREWVAKNINLALKLSDGAKLYIPFRGSTPNAGGEGGVLGSTSGSVNINSASQSQLDTLPGVGKVTAAKIIQNRPYSSVEELLSKKIVGSKVFEQIKDRITIY